MIPNGSGNLYNYYILVKVSVSIIYREVIPSVDGPGIVRVIENPLEYRLSPPKSLFERGKNEAIGLRYVTNRILRV